MVQNVVIPLDGSESAAIALPVGISLANAVDARARVIAIAPTDAELAWTYRRVHEDADAAGIEAANVEVRVDPKPVEVLLEIGGDERNVLCLTSKYYGEPAATLLHSVGSQVIERSSRPVVVAGRNALAETGGTAVVVALDGRNDADPILSVAVAWALRLAAPLRIVTVDAPAPPDVRSLQQTRRFGACGDPDAYLMSVRQGVDDARLERIDTVAIVHEMGVERGLEDHLRDCPGRLIVVGRRHRSRPRLAPPGGVVRHIVATAACPLLVVKHDG